MLLLDYYFIWIALLLSSAASYVTRSSVRWYAASHIQSVREDADAMYEDQEDPERLASLELGLRYFREYAKRAISRFQDGDMEGAIADFDRAAKANSTQPLQQRGMVLYIAEKFEESEQQLRSDIAKLEAMGDHKASELRLWHSASLNRLSQFEEAKNAIDIDNTLCFPPAVESLMMNRTLNFYAGRLALEELLESIGSVDEGDIDAGGRAFYGNFYLGLYYDSKQEMELAQMFLSIPYKRSSKKSKRDMWYHLPRALFKQRFHTKEGDVESKQEGGSEKVTKSGFFF